MFHFQLSTLTYVRTIHMYVRTYYVIVSRSAADSLHTIAVLLPCSLVAIVSPAKRREMEQASVTPQRRLLMGTNKMPAADTSDDEEDG